MSQKNIPSTSRFVAYTDEQLKELTIKKLSKNTTASTKVGVSLLQKFCMGTGKDFDMAIKSKEQLNALLMKFYAGARTEKAEQYKNNSLLSFRNSIQRYFMETQKVNIFDDELFNDSNAIFINILREGKKMGKVDTEHYPEIKPEDLAKLHASFHPNTPTGLLEYIWFNVTFRLIRRGRENLRSMKKILLLLIRTHLEKVSFIKCKVKQTKTMVLTTTRLKQLEKVIYMKREVTTVQSKFSSHIFNIYIQTKRLFGNDPGKVFVHATKSVAEWQNHVSDIFEIFMFLHI